MPSAADAIRTFVTPLLPNWRMQFGRWVDGNKAHRFAVLKPAGGLPAELVRQPQFTMTLIGAEGDEATVPTEAADTVIEAMRLTSGDLVFMQPGEPAFNPTSDGRPAVEFAISAIVD